MPIDDNDIPPGLARQVERCRKELQNLGLVLRGSVTKRWMPCGKKGCRCQADPPELHGPYYQWTTKINGTTKTVRLKRDEVANYERWIAAGRRLDELVAAWKDLSATAAELIRGKSSA